MSKVDASWRWAKKSALLYLFSIVCCCYCQKVREIDEPAKQDRNPRQVFGAHNVGQQHFQPVLQHAPHRFKSHNSFDDSRSNPIFKGRLVAPNHHNFIEQQEFRKDADFREIHDDGHLNQESFGGNFEQNNFEGGHRDIFMEAQESLHNREENLHGVRENIQDFRDFHNPKESSFQRAQENFHNNREQFRGDSENFQKQQQSCQCVHLVACPFGSGERHLGCSMNDGGAGICCPVSERKNPPWGGNQRLFESPMPDVEVQSLSPTELNQACKKGVRSVRSIQAVEHELQKTRTLKKGPALNHQRFFAITRTARDTHHGAMAISEASGSMKKDFHLDHAQSCIGLRKFSARDTILSGNCPSPPKCKPKAKYRTLDGTCNNIHHPLWGKSETAFQRILPAKYDDGIRSPRSKSVLGHPLPNERRISHHVLVDFDNPNTEFTLALMQWGQFADHDLTHSPFASFDNNEGKECCRNGQVVRPQLLEDCWPIEIPRDDEFYARKGQRCMNFIRTMLGEDEECSFGCAEQLNQITHWLDGSNIYGSSVKEANALRDKKTGYLKVSHNNNLPYESKKSHDCEAVGNSPCFAAGDSRVNEQPGLIAIHTIWHREHNRIANKLRHLNPHWSGNAVYQETRRIVIAEYQHILYNEWLPVIVGEPFMKSFDITTKGGEYSFDYNINVNPNMYNEFATAAFRFGHTLVQGTMEVFSRFGKGELRIKDHFNSPHLFQRNPNFVDILAKTFSKQSIQSYDSFITKDLTNHLFETAETDFGMDLMSINIHRGRDHAIATYNEIREICGLKKARSFYDLEDQIPSPTIQRLADVYQHVDDIDFFVGGISERPVSGGLLGWTFLCVVGDQLARVKKGDRFFYDLGGQPSSFRPEQLEAIRKTSWSRILCDNTKVHFVQPLSFRLESKTNPEVPCHSPSIPKVNLNHWRGEKISIFK